jgi:hypothetical protein
MSVAAFFPAGTIPSTTVDQAVSNAAVELRQMIRSALAPERTVAVRPFKLMADRLLEAIRKAAVEEDVRVSAEAFHRAVSVICSLPPHVPPPDIVVEPDGEIALDWDEGRRRVLSVSVGDGPMLSYAALIGAEPIHGRMAFAGALPETFWFLLRRMYH